MKCFLAIIILFLFSACGSESADSSSRDQIEISVDTLCPVDSIGILMGDSCYVFGAIADFTTLPGGRPVVLDQVRGTVSIFDSTGIFATGFGGFGEAPGKFQHPFGIVGLSSGLIAVSEVLGKVSVFDPSGEFLTSWNLEDRGVLPLVCMPFDDSTFVCYSFSMKLSDIGFDVSYSLKRYNAVTGNIVTEYFNWTGSPQPSTDFTEAYLVAACDGAGKMYVSRIQAESWMVEIYGEESAALDTISMFPGREREPAPDTVMVAGVLPVSYAFQDGENFQQERVNMPDHQPFISALGVDENGSIWCRRGGLPGDVWDVISPEGEYLGEALVSLPDSVYFLEVDVNPHGILAFDMFTEDYHKLYIMGNL